jgi:hypothetical protein
VPLLGSQYFSRKLLKSPSCPGLRSHLSQFASRILSVAWYMTRAQGKTQKHKTFYPQKELPHDLLGRREKDKPIILHQ